MTDKRVILLVDDEAIILSVLSVHVKSFLPSNVELQLLQVEKRHSKLQERLKSKKWN